MNKTARKNTHGCVVQIFDDESKCIKQEFIAYDQPCEWEDENGDFIPTPVHDCYPIEMIQPGSTERMCKLLDNYIELLEARISAQNTEIAERLETLEKLGGSMRKCSAPLTP